MAHLCRGSVIVGLQRDVRAVVFVLLIASVLSGCGGSGATSPRIVRSQAEVPHTPGTSAPLLRPAPSTDVPSGKILEKKYERATSAIETFGSPASAQEAAAVAIVVDRYLGSLSEGEYVRACAMLANGQKRSVHGESCPRELMKTFARGFFKGSNKGFKER